MDIKKLLIGTIAGAVVFFLLGWLFYDKLLAGFMRHNPGEKGLIGRVEIKFVYLIAGQLLQGLLLAYILLKSNANSLAAGLVTGLIVGFLLSAAIDFTIYGTSIIMSKKGMLADVLAGTAIWAITGAVVGALTSSKER